MGRVIVGRDEGADRLTLTLPQGDRLIAVGFPLFLLAIVCVTLLGLLALVFDANDALRGSRGGGDGGFFDPSRNHLGFLWLVALFLMLVFLPVYVSRTIRARIVWSFDRGADVFSRNGRWIAALRRVEQVRVRALNDPEGTFLYRLFVIYGDGREILLHQSYDEVEIWILAHEIGDFVGVRAAGKTRV